MHFFVTKRKINRLTYEIQKKGGDDTDFEQIYNSYYMKVYSFVMTLAKNQHIAEEITQKTFFKVMTAGKSFQGESSEFTWLCAIAKNLLADEYRSQKRMSKFDADVSEISDVNIENSFVDEDSAFAIHRVLHNLDEPYKEVFQLRVFGELSFQKIAKLFNKTENWARVTYHRARLKIQERMDDL